MHISVVNFRRNTQAHFNNMGVVHFLGLMQKGFMAYQFKQERSG